MKTVIYTRGFIYYMFYLGLWISDAFSRPWSRHEGLIEQIHYMRYHKCERYECSIDLCSYLRYVISGIFHVIAITAFIAYSYYRLWLFGSEGYFEDLSYSGYLFTVLIPCTLAVVLSLGIIIFLLFVVTTVLIRLVSEMFSREHMRSFYGSSLAAPLRAVGVAVKSTSNGIHNAWLKILVSSWYKKCVDIYAALTGKYCVQLTLANPEWVKPADKE